MSAEEHDRLVARTSHVPQLISTALALQAEGSGDNLLSLAGSGFMDMTRLAESAWGVWGDICKTNADEIDAALAEFVSNLESLRGAVSAGELSRAKADFDRANELIRRFHSSKAIMSEGE
jgi:prephenate dehydrogenase